LENTMSKQIIATVVDDETILLNGNACIESGGIADALRSALESDPNFTLIIRSTTSSGHYKGIGTVIYTSQRVGVPVANLRWQMEDGEVVTFDELKARSPMPPV
jgi:hypothetical protein